MPDKRLLALANECRVRAEEILVKAEKFTDPDAKQRMRELAETYQELAQRLERAARDQTRRRRASARLTELRPSVEGHRERNRGLREAQGDGPTRQPNAGRKASGSRL